MSLRRARLPRRPVTSYENAVRAVLDSPGKGSTDGLALTWAHQIAWAAHSGSLDELEQLAATAERYGVPLAEVLREREKQRQTTRVVPATRLKVPAARLAPSRSPAVARS
jgi:hypothetical protein